MEISAVNRWRSASWPHSQSIPLDLPSCLWLTVFASLGLSDQALRNVVLILRAWPQCWDLNGGLLREPRKEQGDVCSLSKLRMYVTCETQIDCFVYASTRNRGVYLLTDVILWLALDFFFYKPSCTQSAHTIWSQADAAADLRQSPSELNFLPQAAKQNRKTTTKKCVLTYADGKEVNKKNKHGGRVARWKEAWREGGWNLAHLLPWQGSQSCVMVWSLRDGHRAVV